MGAVVRNRWLTRLEVEDPDNPGTFIPIKPVESIDLGPLPFECPAHGLSKLMTECDVCRAVALAAVDEKVARGELR